MPVPLVAALLYWGRILRRPIDPRLKRGHAGGFAVVALGAGVLGLWVRARPPGLADGYVWGELIGVLAVYLLSASLLTRPARTGWSRGSAAWTGCTSGIAAPPSLARCYSSRTSL